MENCMYYKCRSLIACDAGGTVYDTTKKYKNYSLNVSKNMDENQNEFNQLGNIAYIVSNRSKSMVDPITHLDDDEFNEYELQSNDGKYKYLNIEENNNLTDIKEESHSINTIICDQEETSHFVKEDSFNELKNEAFNCTVKLDKSKKKKSFCGKENNKDKSLLMEVGNPFANKRLNSILKKKKRSSKKSKNHRKFEQPTITTFVCNDNSELTNNMLSPEFSDPVQCNTDVENVDYFQYVQPRETIIESNMDILLSPTVEIEFSEINKTDNKESSIEKSRKIDDNGNDIEFNNYELMNNKMSSATTNEIARKKCFHYANIFNTSNDSVINEILFSESGVVEKSVIDICLKPVESTIITENQIFNHSIKPVSCTLLESLNEFNRFGGFVEECLERENLNCLDSALFIPENNDSDQCSEYLRNQQNVNSEIINSNNKLNFIFSKKSSLLGTDIASESTLLNNQTADTDFYSKNNSWTVNNNATVKEPASLKIKIKRVSNENYEYVIDGGISKNNNINEDNDLKLLKNVDRYECYNPGKFKTKKVLKSNVSETHKVPYEIECEICHMRYRRGSSYKKHQPWCQNNVKYKCYICLKVYCYHASLLKHLKTHKELLTEHFLPLKEL